MRLTDFDALTFDMIGTIIDFETGILNWLRPRILPTHPTATDDELLAAYARAQADVRKEDPKLRFSGRFPKMWDLIAAQYGVEVRPEDGRGFMLSGRNWPPFADSVEALQRLKRYYPVLVVATNGDRVSARCHAATLGSPFTRVITEEDMGTNKPNRGAFEYFTGKVAELGIEKNRILHVAQSQYHDIGAAKEFGLATCWIYRRHGKEGYGGTQTPPRFTNPDFLALSLGELADQVEASLLD